jgi:phosphoribosylformylglycinamidine cyclo-ligase
MPETPAIFKLIQEYHPVSDAEMFEVCNMGVGFCVVASEADIGAILSILAKHQRNSWVIGKVIDDQGKGVYLASRRLKGYKKRFHQE